MERVIFEPQPLVDTELNASGCLELRSASGARARCNPVGTAMWLALRQNDGDVADAAGTLARMWGGDPVNLHADLELWIGELCDAGLLRISA